MENLSPYIIPPILSLMVCLALAGIAIHARPRTAERLLFAIVCLWWGLLPPAFISHYLLSDVSRILAIERCIHFLYVFLPALHVVFVHRLFHIRNRLVTVGAFALSTLLASTTWTDLYIQGLYRFDWGYIAKGGPAFQFFGLYGMATLVYMVVQAAKRMRLETNQVRIRKQRYIIISFCLSGALTLLNVPAMNGYDFYPAGNFLFLPLSILAYGVLRYRLMAIRSILLHTAVWALASSLILIPNLLFGLWLHGLGPRLGAIPFTGLLVLWLVVNFVYVQKGHPAIRHWFDRSHGQMRRTVREFIANAVFLRGFDELVAEFQILMKRNLAISSASIYLCHESSGRMVNPMGDRSIEISDAVRHLMESHPYSISLDTLEPHPRYADSAAELTSLLQAVDARYLVPLLRGTTLVGLVLLPIPDHGVDLSPPELKLLDQISMTGVAFSNAAIYKNMADLKQNVEKQAASLAREVEERQRIELALRKSEENHRFMAENIKDVLWAMDMGLSFTYVSPAVEKMQGWTVAEVLDFSLDQFMPPESRETANAAIADAYLQGETTGDFDRHVTLELEQYTQSGETIQTEVTASFMLDGNGRPSGILGVTRDITERVRAGKEREELQQQLARSKKMEALGLLAGGVAHDLNNILSGIQSYPDVLLTQVPAHSPLVQPLKTIRRAGQQAAAVVSDLLTMARGVASSRELTDVNQMVHDHLNSSGYADLSTRHPHARLQTELDDRLLTITCSRVHVEKVLMNLLTNAMESLNGNGVVTIRTQNCVLEGPLNGYDTITPGEYVRLGVSDTGSGISADDLDRIFEPFYTRKRMGRSGTGLGLAIVWNTIMDHDGYIVVESDAQGTCFDLYFPATQAARPAETDTPIVVRRGEGRTVLVVDDDPTQREIASAMLASLGYRAHAVDSGEAAVSYLQEHSVDIMLLDMIMPSGMNGKETYAAISHFRPGQPAVIASGFSETDEVKEAQRLGAGSLLKKPYAIDELGQALSDTLGLSVAAQDQ